MIVTGPQVIAMLRKIERARLAAAVRTMRQVTQMLRTDIIKNRLSKERTGSGWVHVPGTGLKVRGRGGVDKAVAARRALGLRDPRAKGRRWYTSVYRKTSGPPSYPAVLSVLTGHLRKSIYTDVLVDNGRVIGLVGTNVVYGRAHEYRNNGKRAWLRPALRDNRKRIRRMMREHDLESVRVVWTGGASS